MLIKTLVENTACAEGIGTEHGLSLYIETKQHKLLFDVGASDLFMANAQKLGVDLSQVDLLIISHGHHDHGGGLKYFLEINSQAKVYLQQKAFAGHYVRRPPDVVKYVGLAKELESNPRFVFVDEFLRLDEGLSLYSNIQGNRLLSEGARDLLMDNGSAVVEDDFAHEQNLVITENGHTVLIAGCAHKGIVNIITHLNQKYQITPTHVLGGFHLFNPGNGQSEPAPLVNRIGSFLKGTGAQYFTGHCTGLEAFKLLKETMGDQLQYLAGGSVIRIGC
ncbi:MAG: MBL fold metallo-hydrolase [Clostridia bacterium]|jgi:7,8-dihydropterin-6-yl-methyl-4-(beta-D-ribofuranosyl)aminobenzene 5'-phosphate synthase|nr:MBL fold metallo-hydrolase [Clostridia bacterium]